MTCEYEIKTMELFLLGCDLEIVIWGRGGEGRGVIFLGGGRIGKFLAGGGTLQYGKPSDVLFFGLHDPP